MLPFDLLVSFCNIGPWDSRFALARYHCDGGRILERGFFDLAPLLDPVGLFSGITGLCRFRGAIYAGLQGRPSGLLVLRAGRPAEILPLTLVRGIHSITGSPDGRLLIVSTGTDSIIAFDPDTRQEAVFASLSGTAKDSLHVNGITWHQGRPVISLFGAVQQNGPRLGEVRDLLSGEVLVAGLRSPHSVISTGQDLYVLESLTGLMLRWSGGKFLGTHAALIGHVRGLHVGPEVSIIGRSGFREASASFGAHRRHPTGLAGHPPEAVRSGLYLLQADGRISSLELTDVAPEIYDVMALDAADHAALSLPGIPDGVVNLRKALRRKDIPAVHAAAAAIPPPEHLAATLARAEFAGDRDAAIAAALAILELQPGQSRIRVKLAALYAAARDRDQAMHHARIAAATLPEDAALQVEIGTLAEANRSRAEAIIAFRRAQKLAPGGTSVLLKLAALLAEDGQGEEACLHARAALELDAAPAVHLRVAQVLHAAGNTGEARGLLTPAVLTGATRAEAYCLLGQIETVEGNPAEALLAASEAVRIDPLNPRYLLNLAEAQIEAGRFTEAASQLGTLRRNPNPRVAKAARRLVTRLRHKTE